MDAHIRIREREREEEESISPPVRVSICPSEDGGSLSAGYTSGSARAGPERRWLSAHRCSFRCGSAEIHLLPTRSEPQNRPPPLRAQPHRREGHLRSGRKNCDGGEGCVCRRLFGEGRRSRHFLFVCFVFYSPLIPI